MRVTFKYDDRAVVTNDLSTRSAVDFVMLADDYGQHDQPIKTDCTDDPTTDTDSLWYHYAPQSNACKARIQNELTAIANERRALGAGDDVIGPAEAHRWFSPVTAKLDPKKLRRANSRPSTTASTASATARATRSSSTRSSASTATRTTRTTTSPRRRRAFSARCSARSRISAR